MDRGPITTVMSEVYHNSTHKKIIICIVARTLGVQGIKNTELVVISICVSPILFDVDLVAP